MLRLTRPGLHQTLTVGCLGLSQIVGYGTLYYSFAILAEHAAIEFGWPLSWLFGCFSAGLLIGGLLAREIGRRIDRHGAGATMALGTVACAVTLLVAASARSGVVFAFAVVAMQAVSALVLYDAAFAALVQSAGREARRRITYLTLIAGFASTIFWPLTAWLDHLAGWRNVYLCFAIANLIVCLPVHLYLAQQHRSTRAGKVETSFQAHVRAPINRDRTLWLATFGFALAGFSLSAILAQMVPTLTALGFAGSSLAVSTLFGPAQVLIRFAEMLLGARRHPIAASLIALTLVPLAVGIAIVSAPWVVGAILFAVMLGFGSGLKSIVQGTLPLALFGSDAYGARLGFMASVRQVFASIAPFALAFSIENLGVVVSLAITIGIGLAGLACMIVLARSREGSRPELTTAR